MQIHSGIMIKYMGIVSHNKQTLKLSKVKIIKLISLVKMLAFKNVIMMILVMDLNTSENQPFTGAKLGMCQLKEILLKIH